MRLERMRLLLPARRASNRFKACAGQPRLQAAASARWGARARQQAACSSASPVSVLCSCVGAVRSKHAREERHASRSRRFSSAAQISTHGARTALANRRFDCLSGVAA